MSARRRRRYLLLSTSVAALFAGAGVPAAYAASCQTVTNTTVAAVNNSGAITCIDVENSTVNGNVTNTNTGTITATGATPPTRTGITVNGSTIGGTITNAGTITAGTSGHGILVTNANVLGGISNSGTISASTGVGVFVGGFVTSGAIAISTFSGGISNGGTITAGVHGIMLGGTALSGSSVTISTFTGGISNSGTISHATANGIIVGGKATSGASVSVLSFSGDIVNSGAVAAGHGIVVGGVATDFTTASSVSISNFSGSIINSSSGTITANTGSGILVGGIALGTGATVTISTFGGNITNAGTITAATVGIFVGGSAGFGGSLSISNFSGNISNSGMISSQSAIGIMVGGNATQGSTLTIGTFAGGVTNTGTISASHGGGIVLGGVAGFGGALTIGTFDNGITNGPAGAITAKTGILVGGSALFGSALTVSTFAGNIVNSGSITATGHGLVTGTGIWLGGDAVFGSALTINTFAGGISNDLGATITGNNGIVVGGRAFLGGTVTIGTFADGITNAGAIKAKNVGIWVGGVASSGGAVTIGTFAGGINNSGTISSDHVGIFVGGFSSAGAAVTISTFSGGITNSGTINAGGTAIAVTDVSTFFGNIVNKGTIAAGSVGIFVCNCATFAGGAIVNTGSITASTGILVHNFSSVSIFNSGTIVGTGGTAVDLTQASGGNTFTLGPGYSITGNVLAFAGGNDTFQLGGVGSGSFDLSSVGSTQQYQNFANFNVVSGIWTVFNTFGQSQAWNVDGGILAGTGTLSALNVNNGGTLAPGNIGAPGTFMAVTGNLAFQPGATYLVQLDPNVASRVNVGGNASLTGTVDAVFMPGLYASVKTYDILHSGGLNGTTFNNLVTNLPPNFTTTLSYTSTDVFLNLGAALGNGGNLNQNQQSVASALNNFFNNGGTLPPGFASLFGLTGNNLANALTQLDGEDGADAHFGVFQQMNQFLNLMLDPWVDGRHGWGSGGGAIGFAPDQQASFPPDVALAYAGVLKAPPKASFDDRWTVWGSAFGGTASIAGDPVIGSTNVTAGDYGFAAGMDYRASPDTIVGFALAGGGTNWSVAQGLGSGRSDAFMAGAYGTTYWGPAYLAGAVAFANHWLTTNRVALNDQLTANFTGQDLAGRVEAGYRYALPVQGAEIGIAPYAALQAQWFHTPTYSETDLTGGGFGLTYGAATVSDTRSELGARFDDLVTFNDKPLLLRSRLAWAHDWISGATQNAAFTALPGTSFSVNGAATPADSALTTAMAEWHFKPRWSLTAKFDGEFARGAQTYAGTGMLRFSW